MPVDPIDKLTEAMLTTRIPGGTGMFDALMESISKHLKTEFKENRITGKDYADAYANMTGAALGGAIQYLLGKDASYLQAEKLKNDVIMQEFQIANILPKELEKIDAEISGIETDNQVKVAQRDTVLYELANLLPLKKDMAETDRDIKIYQLSDVLPAEVANKTADTLGKTYNNTHILPATLVNINETTESNRAKTLNTRSDGQPVAGAIGKQNDLYNQQIVSYKRDAEHKFYKAALDIWTVQRSTDEGIAPPSQLSNTALNDLTEIMRANLEID